MNEEQLSPGHVSIIMPAYNSERYMTEAIDSVISQSYKDWDLTVIDDGSSDRTFETASEFAQEDNRITVQRNSVNRGVVYSRNRGIQAARGPWIAFLDSDDVWKQERLTDQFELVREQNGASFVFTGTAYVNEIGEMSAYALRPPDRISFEDLLLHNPITCSSVLIKKELLKNDVAIHDGMHEDYAMWLSILRDEPYAYAVPRPLTVHRMTSGSKSSNKIQAARMNYRTLRHVGVGWLAALSKMVQYATRNFRKYSAIYKGFIQESNES